MASDMKLSATLRCRCVRVREREREQRSDEKRKAEGRKRTKRLRLHVPHDLFFSGWSERHDIFVFDGRKGMQSGEGKILRKETAMSPSFGMRIQQERA